MTPHEVESRDWPSGDLNRHLVETPWYRSLLLTAMISFSSSPLLSLRSTPPLLPVAFSLKLCASTAGTLGSTALDDSPDFSQRRGSISNRDVLPYVVLEQVL